MSRLKIFLSFFQRLKGLKYVLVIIAGTVIVCFVDENSMWSHYCNKRRISDMQTEIEKYRQDYKRDEALLERLSTDPKAIEKIAREKYFMKADDEDIFVLSDDKQSETDDETVE
ncbi:FtsB family cell division protein [Xylanibacter muris]|uniref:Septum formation initiator family protein n=1 Tax=Xylanibacter muris TaxID=2736290 RepID=A0ABX2ANP1_9BACT|nr:septum formation initiator family protein [Xylanibacter muris]NPD92809.1 septum formation initiator family protein [Xylanibacter muris]